MLEKTTSEGSCYFCQKMVGQSGMNRHLTTHLNALQKEDTTKRATSFLVYVKADIMFLNLWVSDTTTFKKLDQFLRSIWLECCGHMSAFYDKNGNYIHKVTDEFSQPYPQNVPFEMQVGKVFSKGKKLDYEYDFGSTTLLAIEVKNAFDIKAPQPIVLLSRNEPLHLLCDTCTTNIATAICSVHLYDEQSFFCEKCAKKHAKTCEDFADYARMEVVNSPRMGVCSYSGGKIDTERDGLYKPGKQ